ncbi:MAG TPA: glucosaminidase domain-containing protein, partial [Vicinamibacterales bacterium]|nr:glucosaminidase domain-containing protein [Vicinamibacterales bacterium]
MTHAPGHEKYTQPMLPLHPWWRALLIAGACLACHACAARAPRPVMPYPPAAGGVFVMGRSQLNAAQLAAWFKARTPGPRTYRATVPVETLAHYYIQEGAAEGVAGDVAFMQAIVETGWFAFPGIVRPDQNNFAGIGASDQNPRPASFPDARTGVRAQIQHLRAYADPDAHSCRTPPLHSPCADPRFDLVVPKGKAPRWDDMGNGNWASSPQYGTAILQLYQDARAGARG